MEKFSEKEIEIGKILREIRLLSKDFGIEKHAILKYHNDFVQLFSFSDNRRIKSLLNDSSNLIITYGNIIYLYGQLYNSSKKVIEFITTESIKENVERLKNLIVERTRELLFDCYIGIDYDKLSISQTRNDYLAVSNFVINSFPMYKDFIFEVFDDDHVVKQYVNHVFNKGIIDHSEILLSSGFCQLKNELFSYATKQNIFDAVLSKIVIDNALYKFQDEIIKEEINKSINIDDYSTTSTDKLRDFAVSAVRNVISETIIEDEEHLFEMLSEQDKKNLVNDLVNRFIERKDFVDLFVNKVFEKLDSIDDLLK